MLRYCLLSILSLATCVILLTSCFLTILGALFQLSFIRKLEESHGIFLRHFIYYMSHTHTHRVTFLDCSFAYVFLSQEKIESYIPVLQAITRFRLWGWNFTFEIISVNKANKFRAYLWKSYLLVLFGDHFSLVSTLGYSSIPGILIVDCCVHSETVVSQLMYMFLSYIYLVFVLSNKIVNNQIFHG